ncbi:mitofusin ASCRUDRAFT_24611, partial [Ascoidea rubescens DSM 1968]
LTSQLSQLQYNENRIALDRSINVTIEILNDLKMEVKERPIHYPVECFTQHHDDLLNDNKSLRALQRHSSLDLPISEDHLPSSSLPIASLNTVASDSIALIHLKLLNLNFKTSDNIIGNCNGKLIDNFDRQTLSRLLSQKIDSSINHLLSLRERIDDTSSKVFVTGDLNAGKSTFCNALLRRKLLPEDQQPCTNVFCEVIDSSVNNGIEEVHAIPLSILSQRSNLSQTSNLSLTFSSKPSPSTYNIKDESTYKIFSIHDLHELVQESDKYSYLKVYVNDNRNLDESLLRNGVIDIALIDAPGLNMDSYQTTQVFSRQEEIDLVVFVVNAENHFTLSAKEFITAAARDKNFIFIVVNKFDNIRDKNKCITKILDQVQRLSPDTHKDARDFVHFVSSSQILDHQSSTGHFNNYPNHGNDANNIDINDDPNFDHLDSSLRKFILEKRALSKLAPAKNYLLKILSDVESLSLLNEKLFLKDKECASDKLSQINPVYERLLANSVSSFDEINKYIENVSFDIYKFSKTTISAAIAELCFVDNDQIPYKGVHSIYQYALKTQDLMISKVLESVEISENYAKRKTSEGVEKIKIIGKSALERDDLMDDRIFRNDFMFTKKRDTIVRNLNEPISLLDFFDPSFDLFLGFLGLKKQAEISNRPLNRFGIPEPNKAKFDWKSSVSLIFLTSSAKLFLTKDLILTNLHSLGNFSTLFHSKTSVGLVLFSVGFLGVCWLINDIPNAFKNKFSKKLAHSINDLDYANTNSMRISKECRLILNYPLKEISENFQTEIKEQNEMKEKVFRELKAFEIGLGTYKKL